MELEEKYMRSVAALKRFAKSAGFTDVVIGLSGGIDSSLVATMCVDAFGADHVHGYMMPGPYSSDHSLRDAQELADNLGMEAQVISIEEPYNSFKCALADVLGGELDGLASENTQSRCRMVCLMALSNRYNWMLVNTSNKSEEMMGFSTLYGDTAGAFAPIGGLYKTDVFALSRWCNERARLQGLIPPIPENVLIKPPSAELSPGAEDEKALGIDYATLDKILIEYCEHNKTPEEIIALGFDEAQVRHYLKRTDSYAYKRALEPPYPDDPYYTA